MRALPAAALFLAAAVALQIANRAYVSEFARTYDEAAHFVTGLMVHDFIAGLDWSQPMAFAEEYYLHYPKVGLGHWPPVFYLAQAAWTLVFETSRGSLMALMALVAAAIALTVWKTVEAEMGFWAGLGAGLLFLALPLVQANDSVLMADIPLALLSLWAALAFGRYLDSGSWRWSLAFAGLATLAILTKANGLALALVPLLAVLLSRRFEMARQVRFWIPAVVVLMSCGPWYWLTLDMLKNGPLAASPTWEHTMTAVPTFTGKLLAALGFGLCPFIVLGLYDRVLRPARRGAVGGAWAGLAALLLGALLFHWIVPADFDPRHLALALAPAVCFAAAGAATAVRILPLARHRPGARAALVVGAMAILFLVETFTLPRRAWMGFGAVAEDLVADHRVRSSLLLVSSDPAGEGAFVSEVAAREQRPGHLVLRGSKALARSRWDGKGYQLLYDSPESLWSFLDGTPIGVVVLDVSVPERFLTPDLLLLRQTLQEHRERYTLLGSYPLVRAGNRIPDAVQVYSLDGHQSREVRPVRIDLTEMLGKSLEGAP